MTVLSARLGCHHRECDALLSSADDAVQRGDWSAGAFGFGVFRKELEAHFAAEEIELFPRFEAVTGIVNGPTRVMREEHEVMRQALARMAEALAERDVEAFAGESEALLTMLQQHNMKEEGVLYPMCDRHLAGESSVLAERISRRIEGVSP